MLNVEQKSESENDMKDTNKLIARLFADNFGRKGDDVQAELKGLYRQEGLFDSQDDWLDALEIYFDEATSQSHYRQLYA
jgi:hypothetical protein